MRPDSGSTLYLLRDPWGVSITTSMSIPGSFSRGRPAVLSGPGPGPQDPTRHTPATRRSHPGHMVLKLPPPAGPAGGRNVGRPGPALGPMAGRAPAPLTRAAHLVGQAPSVVAGQLLQCPGGVRTEQQLRDSQHAGTSCLTITI